MLALDPSQLIVLDKLLVILLLNHFPDLFSIKIFNPEIHISKQELVIVVTLLLGIGQTEILESIVVNLLDVFKAFVLSFRVVSSCEMAINKGERSVIEVESKTH